MATNKIPYQLRCCSWRQLSTQAIHLLLNQTSWLGRGSPGAQAKSYRYPVNEKVRCWNRAGMQEREIGSGFCIPRCRRVLDTAANVAAGGWWDRDSWGVGRNILTGVCGDTLRKDRVCVQVPKYQNIHMYRMCVRRRSVWVSYAGSRGRWLGNNEGLVMGWENKG